MLLTFRKVCVPIGIFLIAVSIGYVLDGSLREPVSPGRIHTNPGSVGLAGPASEIRGIGRPVFSGQLGADAQTKLRELEMLAVGDPRKALTRLPFFRDTDLMEFALSAIGRGWARNDPLAAAEWLATLDSAEDQVAVALGLVPVWTRVDPDQCLASACKMAPGVVREVWLVEVADAWVSGDPAAALERFLALPPEVGTERGLHAIVSQWVLDDSPAAIEQIARLDRTNRRDEFLETALVSLSTRNPDLAWMESVRFDDPSRIGHVRGIALEAMAETRPGHALQLAESIGSPPDLMKAVAIGWASWDKPGTVAWLATLPDAGLRESLLDSITD